MGTTVDPFAPTRTDDPLEAAPPQRIVTQPSRGDVIAAIQREARAARKACDAARANRAIQAYEAALVRLRAGDPVYHVTKAQMADVHAVMDVITPDFQIAPPAGSAHEAINLLLLSPGEYSLVHTKDGGRNEYCAIKLHLE